MKSRTKRVLLWSSLGLALMLIASLFVMNYAIDRVLRSMSGMDVILSEEALTDPSDKTNTKFEGANLSNQQDQPGSSDAVQNSVTSTDDELSVSDNENQQQSTTPNF